MSEMTTPPQLARRWRVATSKVLAFINSGELVAIDMSMTPGKGRPRYKISEEAIREFENRRASKPARRVRRAVPVALADGEVDFFPGQ